MILFKKIGKIFCCCCLFCQTQKKTLNPQKLVTGVLLDPRREETDCCVAELLFRFCFSPLLYSLLLSGTTSRMINCSMLTQSGMTHWKQLMKYCLLSFIFLRNTIHTQEHESLPLCFPPVAHITRVTFLLLSQSSSLSLSNAHSLRRSCCLMITTGSHDLGV